MKNTPNTCGVVTRTEKLILTHGRMVIAMVLFVPVVGIENVFIATTTGKPTLRNLVLWIKIVALVVDLQ
jgi:hypothetical protein